MFPSLLQIQPRNFGGIAESAMRSNLLKMGAPNPKIFFFNAVLGEPDDWSPKDVCTEKSLRAPFQMRSPFAAFAQFSGHVFGVGEGKQENERALRSK